MTKTDRPLVAVVGAGIAGLAAAWELTAGERPPRVVVLEASARAGGKLRTSEISGRPIDEGADAFLARVPDAAALAREIGLGDDLVAPATGTAWLWSRGRLRSLPAGFVLGVPTRLRPLVRSGLISPLGGLRAGLDWVLPGSWPPGDRTVGSVIRRRFGGEVADVLVDPLVGGINASSIDRLSIQASTPQLAAALGRGGSLARALRPPAGGAAPAGGATPAGGSPTAGGAAPTGAGPAAGGGPVFWGIRGGMDRLPGRLVERLVGKGVELRTGTAVSGLRREGASWRLGLAGGELEADAVVVAVPPRAAADLLSGAVPAAGRELGAIRSSSVVLVALSYRSADVPSVLAGSGVLVPRREGRLMTACTWFSSKWPETAEPEQVLLRVSAGRDGDERAMGMGDRELVRRLGGELGELMGIRGKPVDVRVTRWPEAFPQYDVGHLDRVGRLEGALDASGGIAVAGAAYRGVGVPACIAGGQRAARSVLAGLRPEEGQSAAG